jgi:hypothetical protein
VNEADGRMEDAIVNYRTAREVAASCQVAGFALSNALRVADRLDEAAEVARAVASAGPEACEDPWWSYGEAWQLYGELAALRRAVRD